MARSTVKHGFVAFASSPPEIGESIRASLKMYSVIDGIRWKSWESVSNWGQPLITPIIAEIGRSDVIIADITRLNLNVTFEVGFAIGARKAIGLVTNKAIVSDKEKYEKLGVFDTIGYKEYSNSSEFAELLQLAPELERIRWSQASSNRQVYILEPVARTELAGYIASRVKKARLQFGTFVPTEETRLVALKAAEDVSSSTGVIVTLAPKDHAGNEEHNFRASFFAGLALGMRRRLLILAREGERLPLDLRDRVITYRDLSDIDEHFNQFAFDVHGSGKKRESLPSAPTNRLAELSIGDPVAENEFNALSEYFLETDAFNRAKRGEINLVVGRKGTGKTAMFNAVRNFARQQVPNVVLDLKPEGYQLIKLREEVTAHLTEGSKRHLIIAFWEYIIYMELAHKLLEKDEERHYREPDLYEPYVKLRDLYEASSRGASSGDFSERIWRLSNDLVEKYKSRFSGKGVLLTNEVTELVHSDTIHALREAIVHYLSSKSEIWVLFDNLDRGWATGSTSREEVFVIRCLLDAARIIRNDVRRRFESFNIIVFLRNDIYEVLMSASPDFGKDTRVSLDWEDGDQLAELLRRRLAASKRDMAPLQDLLGSICTLQYKGVDTVAYLLSLTFHRPRNLLRLFNYMKAVAVNLSHERITEADIEKGVLSYSDDVLVDISNELRDLSPEAEDLLYRFIGDKASYRKSELERIILTHGIDEMQKMKVIEYLLYYGAFGISVDGAVSTFIFDVGYNIKKMQALSEKFTSAEYVIHNALRPALGIRW
ncbi:MAG: hypothetical protein VX640_12670 [Pseudomonadota bacterium]|nr:hypothetical protein [Pseudomonadota bacterium]